MKKAAAPARWRDMVIDIMALPRRNKRSWKLMDIFLKEGPGSFVTIWMHNEHEKNKKIPSWLSNVWYAFTCFHFSYGGILKWKCTTQVNFNGPIGSGWKATLKGAAAGLLSDGLFKIKLDFFGVRKASSKKLSTEREEELELLLHIQNTLLCGNSYGGI